MPGRYSAQGQSLFGNVGSPNPPRPLIDVGGAIDSLTQGATSMIHNAMLRRNAENENAYRQAQLGVERDREAREAANQAAEFGLRQQSERHRFIEAGGIPAHTDTQAVGTSTPITPMQQAPLGSTSVANAMMSATAPTPASAPAPAPGVLPGVQVTPSASAAPAPITSSTTAYHPENVTTPESFDPTRGAAYERGVAVQQLRNNGFVTREEARQEFQSDQQTKRLAAQKEGREYAASAAKGLAQWKHDNPTPKSAVQRAMSQGQEEQMLERVAGGLIQAHGGSLDDALDAFRNTSQGRDLAKQGMTENHFLAASRSARPDRSTTQILGLVNSGAAKDVNDAAATVTAAQKASSAMRLKTPTAPAPSSGTPTAVAPGASGAPAGDIDLGARPAPVVPSTASPTPAPVTVPARPPAKGAAPKDDFSDAELADAYDAGKHKDADIMAFIRQQRLKKSKSGAK